MDKFTTTVYTHTSGGELSTEDGPFTSDTVTNIYSYRLRTGLGLQQPTGRWTNHLGNDRNRVIHEGVSPTKMTLLAFFLAEEIGNVCPTAKVQFGGNPLQ